MQNLLTNISDLTEKVESFRMPILGLVAAVYGFRIIWKFSMGNDAKGIWEDIITLLVAVGALILLPGIIKAMAEYMGA